jgi:hypothetical protein
MNISKIVDEKSESLRFGLIFIGSVVHNGLIDEACLVVTAVGKPLDDLRNSLADMVLIELEVWIVID